MELGLNGASGQPAAQSAHTGGVENAQPPPPKTAAKTAAACCSIPKTAPMGFACKVSPLSGGENRERGKGSEFLNKPVLHLFSLSHLAVKGISSRNSGGSLLQKPPFSLSVAER